MSVPNLKHIVQQVRSSRPWDFSTKEGLCAYSGAVVVALHRADPNFVFLKKKPGQNQCNGRGVDVALYLPTGQSVDFIGSAGVNAPNPVTWGVSDPVGKYDADDALIPEDAEDTQPTQPPAYEEGTWVPEPPVEDVDRIALVLQKLDELKAQSDANTEKIQQQIDQAINNFEKSVATILPLFVGSGMLPAVTARLFGNKDTV